MLLLRFVDTCGYGRYSSSDGIDIYSCSERRGDYSLSVATGRSRKGGEEEKKTCRYFNSIYNIRAELPAFGTSLISILQFYLCVQVVTQTCYYGGWEINPRRQNGSLMDQVMSVCSFSTSEMWSCAGKMTRRSRLSSMDIWFHQVWVWDWRSTSVW